MLRNCQNQLNGKIFQTCWRQTNHQDKQDIIRVLDGHFLNKNILSCDYYVFTLPTEYKLILENGNKVEYLPYSPAGFLGEINIISKGKYFVRHISLPATQHSFQHLNSYIVISF